MRVKLNILNMKEFLRAVNKCSGTVDMVCSDAGRVNINKQEAVQCELLDRFREGGGSVKLCLEIPASKDYLNIISYYAGDC